MAKKGNSQQQQGAQNVPSRGAYESYDDTEASKGQQNQSQPQTTRMQDDGRKPSTPMQGGRGGSQQCAPGTPGERSQHGEDQGDNRADPAGENAKLAND